MMSDIVLDANVCMHADNRQEARQARSQDLLHALRDCKALLCVDEGFHPVEAHNRSIIFSEYLRHLRFGMLGYAVIAHLASSRRIKELPRRVPGSVAKVIRTQVRRGPDRTYVQVAFNSDEKTLVSHDFGDLPVAVRRRLRAALDVRVLEAAQAAAVLRAD